jgi:hypothetical protein
MKFFSFKNFEGNTCFINSESKFCIINGVRKIDQQGRPVLNAPSCSMLVVDGMNIIISNMTALAIMKRLATKVTNLDNAA